MCSELLALSKPIEVPGIVINCLNIFVLSSLGFVNLWGDPFSVVLKHHIELRVYNRASELQRYLWANNLPYDLTQPIDLYIRGT